MKLEKSPFCNHQGNHGFRQKSSIDESQERTGFYKSLKLSPHRTLTNYRGRIQWRNLVGTTWTKWLQWASHSGTADSCVPDRTLWGEQNSSTRNGQPEPAHEGSHNPNSGMVFKGTDCNLQKYQGNETAWENVPHWRKPETYQLNAIGGPGWNPGPQILFNCSKGHFWNNWLHFTKVNRFR